MQLLEIDSVNFSYGINRILSDIYLKVSQGEVVGFLGLNGCGKSTLLKVLFGVLKGESHSVRINGVHYPQVFKSGLVKFLPQEGMFPKYLTPKKAIELYESDAAELDKLEELQQHQDYKFGELSSGMAKYIETLIVLHSPCSFLLMDESFSFIAPVYTEKLIPMIKSISKKKGILLTDHQYKSILEVSDRLYLMREQSLYPVTGKQDLQDMGYINLEL